MKPYYDNSHLCAECTGAGCNQCKGTGVTRWPLSHAMNVSCPPAIARRDIYWWKFYRVPGTDYTLGMHRRNALTPNS